MSISSKAIKLLLAVLFLAGSASAQVVTGGSGGGITQVSSIPGTCTSTSAPVQLTVAPFGIYTCGPSGTYQLAGSAGSSILAASFGVKADTRSVWDASVTNGTAIVTCPNSDCNFTSADVGKIVWMTNLVADINILTTPSVLVMPQTTVLSVDSAQQIHTNANATVAGCVGNCVLVLGSDDTAALASAWTGTIAVCGTLQLPQGMMITQSAQFNTNAVRDRCLIDLGYGSYGVQGMGSPNTVIVPSPNFDPATCTGTSAGDGCFFGATSEQVQGLSIWGSGMGLLAAGFNGKTAVHLTGADALTTFSNSYAYNVLLASWGARTTGFTGLIVSGMSDALLVGVHLDGMGSVGCYMQPPSQGAIYMYNQFCAVNDVKSLYMTPPATGAGVVYSFGGVYGQLGSTNGQNAIEVNDNGAGGTLDFFSNGDNAPYAGGTGAQLWCHGSGKAICHITQGFYEGINNTVNAVSVGTLTTVFAENSQFINTAVNANAVVGGGATSKFVSLGGNTFSANGGGTSKAVNLASFGGQFFPNPTDTFVGITTDIIAGTTGTGACATTSTNAGLGTVGTVTCTGTTGASTLIIAPHFTAAHGWSCTASDLTTAANVLRQSATSTTGCTIAGTVNLNDVITFTATAY